MKGLIVIFFMVLSVVFLLNPGAGVFAEIPDIVPFFGNLDEAAAMALLISCLAYFGIDLGHLFGRSRKKEREEQDAPREVEGKVVDVEREKEKEPAGKQ